MNITEKALGDIRVLDKVRKIILLPKTELVTIPIVADWFEISEETILKTIRDNQDELIENGLTMKEEQLNNEATYTVVLSKRAVLNLATMIDDSKITKRLRIALLDQII